MTSIRSSPAAELAFELRFDSLRQRGRSLSFPCDAGGRVDLDHLSERSRRDYLFAHMLTGRDFAVRVIRGIVQGSVSSQSVPFP